MTVDVIFPAGGRISGSFAEEAGAEIKALIRLGNGTLLGNIAESVRSAGCVNRMVAVGPEAIWSVAEHLLDAVLPESESGPENIYRGVSWLRAQPNSAARVLIVTTDLPFVTPDSVTGFLDGCPRESDICLPLFSKQEFQARFPGSMNNYVRLRDGEWTVGCVFLLRQTALEQNRANIDRLFKARKSAMAMARLLGPFFVARYLSRTLRVAHLLDHCYSLTGCTAAAIRGCDPVLAFDIDEPQDFHYARALQPRVAGVMARQEDTHATEL